MRDEFSHSVAFAQGIQKQLVHRAKEAMCKRALNPRVIEKVIYDARRTPELAALGQSIFARSYRQSNPLKGMLMTGLAGYGQLRNLHADRMGFIREIAGLRGEMNRLPEGNANREFLANRIADKMNAFKSEKRTRLAEVGATAEPRLKFLRTTVPATVAGGAALGAGSVLGNLSGQAASQKDVSGAPFGSRLQYLLNPSKVPSSVMPQPQDPGSQTSSATDSGGV
jgi:hypothetical protein